MSIMLNKQMEYSTDIGILKVSGYNYYDVERTSILAAAFTHEYFEPIVESEEIINMLVELQDVIQIENQIKNDFSYYLVEFYGEAIGFMLFYPVGITMHIEKFWIKREFRKKDISRIMFEFIKSEAIDKGLKSIYLAIHPDKLDEILIFKHFGFNKHKYLISCDMGSGFIMDNLCLTYILNN